MRKRMDVLCFFLFLLSNGVVSVASGGTLEIQKTLTSADGLASDTVLAILEDRRGDMWFGTTEGVTHFNGKQFRTFTTADGLTQNTIGLLFEDRHGQLWFGDGVLSSIRERETSVDISLMEMPLSELANMSEDETQEGIRKLLSRKGVSRYDGQAFRIFTTADGLADDTVRDIFEDKTGTLWFATSGGVSRYDGKRFTNLLMSEPPIGMEVLPEWWNEIVTIGQDTAGNFWLGSTAGITYYPVETSQPRYFAVDASLRPFQEMGDAPSGNITDLQFDSQENLWISRGQGGNEQSGIHRYDGKKLTTFPTSEQLPMNSVNNIMQDSNGNLWFSGVKKRPPTLQETEDSVTMIYPETGAGVSVYDGETFQNFDTDDGLPSNRVWSVFEDRNGNLWFATDAGAAVGVYLPSQYSGSSSTR